MCHQPDPTHQTPSRAALQTSAPAVSFPTTARQNRWTKNSKTTITTDSRSQNTYVANYNQDKDMHQHQDAAFTIYVGKVLRLPISGLWVKGASKTPFLSMCRRSRAYMLRFFLAVSPEPQVTGSHSFLIHSAHCCRSDWANVLFVKDVAFQGQT